MKRVRASLISCAILLAQIHTAEALSLVFRLIKLDDHLVQTFIGCYPAVQLEMKRPESKESGSPRRVILDRCGLPKDMEWELLEFAVTGTLTPEDIRTVKMYVDEEHRLLAQESRTAKVSEVYAANRAVLKKHNVKLKPIISDMKRKAAKNRNEDADLVNSEGMRRL
jgi:hypothetical protein